MHIHREKGKQYKREMDEGDSISRKHAHSLGCNIYIIIHKYDS